MRECSASSHTQHMENCLKQDVTCTVGVAPVPLPLQSREQCFHLRPGCCAALAEDVEAHLRRTCLQTPA